VLLVGSGGREHALAWKLAQSPRLSELHAAPGNPGIGRLATLHPVELTDLEGMTELAARLAVDLVVVGPEAPLADGLADRITDAGLRCFGPSAAAARLESSKAFAKSVMQAAGVPTARAIVCDTVAAAQAATVARAILGGDPGVPPSPYFWSDQFGVRIQHVGLPTGWTRVVVEDDGESLEARYLADGDRLVAALLVNRPRVAADLRRRLGGEALAA